jgi:hypothetical protein
VGQQPNLELVESDLPRRDIQPAPPDRWRPTKPGMINSPEEKPSGGLFGYTGPDPGWALRLLAGYELPSPDPDLASVVAGLTMARAAALGRAALVEDIEAALVMCGYGEDAPAWVIERRQTWLAAAPHDKRPGETAVADVDIDVLVNKPDQIRYVLQRSEAPPRREHE